MTDNTWLPSAAKPFAIVEADFGDDKYKFGLSWKHASEWEKEHGRSLYAVFLEAVRLRHMALHDIREAVRLALVGAGAEPTAALRLVRQYVEERPGAENLPLAVSILDAFFHGQPAQTEASDGAGV